MLGGGRRHRHPQASGHTASGKDGMVFHVQSLPHQCAGNAPCIEKVVGKPARGRSSRMAAPREWASQRRRGLAEQLSAAAAASGDRTRAGARAAHPAFRRPTAHRPRAVARAQVCASCASGLTMGVVATRWNSRRRRRPRRFMDGGMSWSGQPEQIFTGRRTSVGEFVARLPVTLARGAARLVFSFVNARWRRALARNRNCIGSPRTSPERSSPPVSPPGSGSPCCARSTSARRAC